ncbi:MAG: methionyl-tRNA formyltransferase [Verrucomicrobiota bacterium]
MSSPLRIVFLGSDAIALPLLQWIAGDGAGLAQVIGVYTQPDRPVGRGQKVQANAIKVWAGERNIPVWQPEKLTEDVRQQLAGLGADLGLVMAYGHILKDEFIATLPHGMLNLHTSILPKYRGASPIQTAVASGDRETGVTLMRIVRRLDAGPIVDVERVAINRLDTALEVEAELAQGCVPLVARGLQALVAGTITFREQDDAASTHCRKLEKGDGVLDFTAPASVLAARINGLFPWPSCSVEIGGQLVKLGLADVGELAVAEGKSPGEVLGADTDGLLVATGATGADVLRLRKLQRPGGRMLAAGEFLRGFPVAAGTLLASRPMPELVTGPREVKRG